MKSNTKTKHSSALAAAESLLTRRHAMMALLARVFGHTWMSLLGADDAVSLAHRVLKGDKSAEEPLEEVIEGLTIIAERSPLAREEADYTPMAHTLLPDGGGHWNILEDGSAVVRWDTVSAMGSCEIRISPRGEMTFEVTANREDSLQDLAELHDFAGAFGRARFKFPPNLREYLRLRQEFLGGAR